MRTPHNKANIDERLMIDLYINHRMTTYQVAEVFHLNQTIIARRLLKYGLTRNKSESHKGQIPWNYKGEKTKTKSGLERAI